MVLKSFKFIFGLYILLSLLPLNGEEKIDIWSQKNKNNSKIDLQNSSKEYEEKKIKLDQAQSIKPDKKIEIKDGISEVTRETKVFGIYDPANYNFNLNMWSSTSADDVRSSFKRLEKINLSQTSEEILENVLLSYSYPPQGMSEKEFLSLKINWLIERNRSELIENFLKQNQEFEGKGKVIQYLVDKNISKANIKEGCNKIEFIDSSIKDSYLEKFKIYCLVFNDKKAQAQLLLDLLREQNQSDKFFDDKINYLLGITQKTSEKINEKNLLNFYLSSVTIKNFNYQPNNKTKKEIWAFLNSANLIKLEDINDKSKIRDLEIAANKGQVKDSIIFDIYRQVPFQLNTLINAKNLYQSLDGIEARSLIFQKFLLSEDYQSKIEYLFILDELFKKDNLVNVYSNTLNDNLKKIGLENIPEEYKEIAKSKIKNNKENQFKKVKYNDKILHQSKIIKFYLENESDKKIQKDIDKVFKKINKNKKYFYSAKDLALVEALAKDGFKIPTFFKYQELAGKYEVPKNLAQLITKKQNAFLALKIVEIIGEDEPHQLDPETIYFITNLLNETNLIKIRNKVLISALPKRV